MFPVQSNEEMDLVLARTERVQSAILSEKDLHAHEVLDAFH